MMNNIKSIANLTNIDLLEMWEDYLMQEELDYWQEIADLEFAIEGNLE